MHTHMKKITLTLVAAVTAILSHGQIKEGSITYSVKAEGLPKEYEPFFAGAESKVYFKEKKYRMDFATAMNSQIITADDKQMMKLEDMMGQKSYYVRKKESIDKEVKALKKEDPKITYVDETKSIAGYECKKAIIEEKNKKGEVEKSTVWYCDKFSRSETVASGSAMKGLKGVPFEFEINTGMAILHLTASQVSTAPIPDSIFNVSTEGYTETSYEEEKRKAEERRKMQNHEGQ